MARVIEDRHLNVDAMLELVEDHELYNATYGTTAQSGYKLDLRRCTIDAVDLSGRDLRGATLGDCNLHGSTFDDAALGGVLFYGANLSGASMAGANLTKAHLDGVDLTAANLAGARLWRASFSGAILRDANLTGVTGMLKTWFNSADLRGCDFTDAEFAGLVSFAGASVAGIVLSDSVVLDNISLRFPDRGINIAPTGEEWIVGDQARQWLRSRIHTPR